MNHRTIAVLRAAALVPLVSLALLGVALAVAGGELTTLLLRVGFLTAGAGVVTGALRWSVLPSASPPLVAGAVALWVLALSGAAGIGNGELARALRNAMSSARSCGLPRPAKVILVPGANWRGERSQSFIASKVQVPPLPRSASE